VYLNFVYHIIYNIIFHTHTYTHTYIYIYIYIYIYAYRCMYFIIYAIYVIFICNLFLPFINTPTILYGNTKIKANFRFVHYIS